MNSSFKSAVVTAVFAAVLFIFSSPELTSAAFGISPPFLNADHLVKGAKYVQTIYLVQDQPNEDLNIKANLILKEPARSWVTVDKGFDFVIPKGTRQFPVQVAVNVPKDAGLGVYSGNLTFTGAPSQKGQVTIALGVQVAINLTVGEGIYEKFNVQLIRFPDIEEGWNPLVYVKFANEGNVPESFDGATYELIDQYGGVRLAYAQKNSDFPETPPFSVKEYTLEFPVNFHLGVGQYWASVNFYQRQKIVASQKTIFTVLKAGSLSGPGGRILNSLKNIWFIMGGGAAAIIILSLIMRSRRRSA